MWTSSNAIWLYSEAFLGLVQISAVGHKTEENQQTHLSVYFPKLLLTLTRKLLPTPVSPLHHFHWTVLLRRAFTFCWVDKKEKTCERCWWQALKQVTFQLFPLNQPWSSLGNRALPVAVQVYFFLQPTATSWFVNVVFPFSPGVAGETVYSDDPPYGNWFLI